MINVIVRIEIGQHSPAFGAPTPYKARPINMITGPITTGDSTCRILPTSPEKPIVISMTAPTSTAPAMYCIISDGSPPCSLTAAMIPANAAKKLKLTPWIIGSLDPNVA